MLVYVCECTVCVRLCEYACRICKITCLSSLTIQNVHFTKPSNPQIKFSSLLNETGLLMMTAGTCVMFIRDEFANMTVITYQPLTLKQDLNFACPFSLPLLSNDFTLFSNLLSFCTFI